MGNWGSTFEILSVPALEWVLIWILLGRRNCQVLSIFLSFFFFDLPNQLRPYQLPHPSNLAWPAYFYSNLNTANLCIFNYKNRCEVARASTSQYLFLDMQGCCPEIWKNSSSLTNSQTSTTFFPTLFLVQVRSCNNMKAHLKRNSRQNGHMIKLTSTSFVYTNTYISGLENNLSLPSCAVHIQSRIVCSIRLSNPCPALSAQVLLISAKK